MPKTCWPEARAALVHKVQVALRIKAAARNEIASALEQLPAATEHEVRVIIANAVADASSTSFREDVRARKLTIATGVGNVHGETFVLSSWGLTEAPADVA